ncbi:phosphopentomutase [bacterium]|nr:phosphopentomutase [bacterium]
MAGKALVIILDGAGAGEMPDADKFNDIGSNTLGNLAEAVGGMSLPNLEKLGLGNIIPVKGVPPQDKPAASYGKMAELSPAKDSTAGHWELMGLPVDKSFPTYPAGFPDEIVNRLKYETGYDFIGNTVASGTEIIRELGAEHLKTGALILYTSADSVLQIAAHEDLIPVEELYRVCRTARTIMSGEHAVARIIARPFTGEPGYFTRTRNRHDFSLQPPGDTVLDILNEAGIAVIGIGKIYDLFGGKGVTKSYPTNSNSEGIEKTIELASECERDFIFTNLVDFDMLWGHRNDAAGYYQGLKEFDAKIPALLEAVKDDDILIFTADHGCDPTTISTDHSREYVPLLAWGRRFKKGVNLGIRRSFADVGASIAEFYCIEYLGAGVSFLGEIT